MVGQVGGNDLLDTGHTVDQAVAVQPQTGGGIGIIAATEQIFKQGVNILGVAVAVHLFQTAQVGVDVTLQTGNLFQFGRNQGAGGLIHGGVGAALFLSGFQRSQGLPVEFGRPLQPGEFIADAPGKGIGGNDFGQMLYGAAVAAALGDFTA